MRRTSRLAACIAMIAAMLAGSPTAFGQNATGAAAPERVPESTQPGKSGSSGGPLSDKLDRTDGVIHPPAGVDPEIRQAPPAAGPHSTPVIPPPGTPGSLYPHVEPK
jgi:hypothetical protein